MTTTKTTLTTTNNDTPLTIQTLTKQQRRKLQHYSRKDERLATLGVVNLLVTCLLAVKVPQHYWIWHLVRTSFYIPMRYIRFRRLQWQLYLLDWCYVVTYLSTICSLLAFVRFVTGLETYLVRYNTALIHAGFAMACGPLAWSAFIYRNSIVFHDIDHSTSVFIHLSPFALFWCLRWGAGQPSIINDTWPNMFQICGTELQDDASSFQQVDECFHSLSGMIWCPACGAPARAFLIPPAMLYLCVWSVPYYLIVLVRWRDWCQQTGHSTLFSYTCETSPDLIDKYARYLTWLVGEANAAPLAYMIVHFVSVIVFSATGYIFWHSFVLHTLWMAMVLVKAIDNGSSFMFRVFAYRYASDCLDRHRDKLD